MISINKLKSNFLHSCTVMNTDTLYFKRWYTLLLTVKLIHKFVLAVHIFSVFKLFDRITATRYNSMAFPFYLISLLPN